MTTIEEIVNKHWDQMFHEVLKIEGDGLYELVIEVKIDYSGKTIRKSWKDRNEMLKEEI